MPSEQNKAFESIWQDWLRKTDLGSEFREHYYGRAHFIEFVESQIQKIGRTSGQDSKVKVLEVGCGTAIDSLCLANRLGATFYASDLSLRALVVATRMASRFPKPVFLAASGVSTMCFPDETFDLVFSQGLLEHFRDPDPIVAEQARVTKRGGLVIVDVPQTFNLYTLYKKYQILRAKWPYGWETQYSAGKLKNMGRRHGLTTVAVGSWGDNWGFVLRNKLRALGAFDELGSMYFRVMNRLFPNWAHYYRLSVSVCFLRSDERRSV